MTALSHRLWMTPVASYVGLAALLYAPFSGAPAWWWTLAVPCTLALLLGVTVGMHRLFCHAAFRTSAFWHGALGVLGTLALYGSTVQWAAMHMTHHRHADTDLDPHYTGWRYLLWKKNRPTRFHGRTLMRLYRQPLHRWLHRRYVLVVAATVAGLAAISPHALVFCYLIPLGWLHLVGSAHQVFAHGTAGPRDQGWLELALPTGGEWLHGHHHARPKDPRFGRLDLGWWFIRLIRR